MEGILRRGGHTVIISTNRKPAYDDFRRLMKKTDEYLNADAAIRPGYYRNRTGKETEDDIASRILRQVVQKEK